MKIDMSRNYWNEYYTIRKVIENGKGTNQDYQNARNLLKLAKTKKQKTK